MLRELIDIATLEDFVRGLSRASAMRVAAFDNRGSYITGASASSAFAMLTNHTLRVIPADVTMVPVPAPEPPAVVAFIESAAVYYVAAPVYVDDQLAGYVAVGEFRGDGGIAFQEVARQRPGIDAGALRHAWDKLPPLDRGVNSQAVAAVRWGARVLGEWCRRELRMTAATEQIALIGDIAELLRGEHGLQAILDRIVAETARVMGCRFCSLRLYNPQTDELTIRAVYGLSRKYLEKGPVLRSQNTTDEIALRGEMVYVEDAGSDPRVRYPEEARLEGIVSVLTVGMIYRGDPVGVIRVYTDRRQRFRRAQRNLLAAVADHAAIAVVHAGLIEARLRAAETERQLALAGQIQARMASAPLPEHKWIESARVFQPSFQVGGDFCDVLTLCDGRVAAVVGDVVGKGIPASLLMASVRGALRAMVDACVDLGEIVARLNRHVCAETTSSEFVTLLLIALDTDARGLSYCCAGHEPLLHWRSGAVTVAGESSLVLGVDPAEEYAQRRVDLLPGDALLLYTDGAVEAYSFAGELFGRARLRSSFEQHGALPPQHALQAILWDIRRFVGLAEQADDLTLVGLRIRPEA